MDVFNETLVTSGDGESPGYIISLDGIDLNMFSQFSYRRGGLTVPLWSPSSDLGMEYYEFEVLAEEGGDSDDERRENARTEKCHMCDVDVPSFYWQDHLRSATHRACKSIADTSLRRAQKTVLNTAALPSRPPRPPLTSFCPPCARAVATSNTQTHRLSEEHSKSVRYVKLLESLAKLFENKDNFDSVYKDVSDCVMKGKEEIKDNAVVSSIDCDNKDNFDNIDKEIIDREKKEREENSDDATEDAKRQNRSYAIIYPKSGAKLRIPLDNYHGFYTVENKTLCRVCRVLVEDKFEHEWAMEHRKIVEAAVMDKHCIRELSHTLIHCMLCNDIFGNAEHHILCGSKHSSLLENALLVDDKTTITEDSYTKEVMEENFIENIAFNKDNYYCKLCNIYFIKSTLFEHVAKKAHKNNLATLNLKKKGVIKGEKMSGYCTVCQLNIQEGKKAEKRHRRSKDHKYKEWLSEKDSRLHYLMKTSGYPNEVVCQVCRVQISGNVYAINKHIASNDHKTNYKNVLDENFMEETSDIKVNCTLCKVTEYVIDVLDHIKTKCHNKRIISCRSLRIGNVELKQLRSENVVAESPRDNTKVTEVLENNRICVYNEYYYQCKLCLQCFKKPNIFDHVISKKHERRLLEFVSENTAVKSKQEAASLQTENVNERAEKIHTNSLNILTGNDTTHTEPTNGGALETKDNDLVTKLEANGIEMKQGIHYCGVCDLAILNGFEEPHIESESHLNSLAKAQRFSANGLSKTGSTYYCSLCLEAFKRDYAEVHLESPIHRTNFCNYETLSAYGVLKTGLNFFCNICLVSVQRESAMEHIKSVDHIRDFQRKSGANLIPSPRNLNFKETVTNPVKTHDIYQPNLKTQKLAKKLHYLFEDADFDNDVTCLACKTKMSFDQVMSHRKSNDHKEVYKSLMDANTMFRIKHRCFCECCRKIMKVNEEYIHLTSDGHIFNLTHTTERMDKDKLKELSFKLFTEDIAAEKKARRQERSAKFDLAEEDSDGCGENRFENLKALLFLNSPVKKQKYKDDIDNSFSDSNDSFVSAVSDISVGESQDLKVEIEDLHKKEDSNEPQEYEIKGGFVKTSQDLTVEIDSNEPQEYEIKVEFVKTSQDLKVEIEDLHKNEDSNEPQEYETEAEFVKTIAHLFEESDNSKQVLCKLCHFAVGNRSDLIREHVIGVKHTKNYEGLLLCNNLKEIVVNFSETIEKYRCKACGIDIGTSELFIHINSDKHRFYLTVQPSSSGYSEPSKDPKADLESDQQKERESINVSVKKHDTALKIKDDEMSSLLPQIKKYLMQKDKNNLLFCKICDCDFFYYDLNYHVKTHIHELNYKSFLLENDVRIVGTKFFCDLCKIVLMEDEELEHVYGDKHSANFKFNSFPSRNNKIHKTITNKENEPNLISKAENKPQNVTNGTKIYVCKVCNVKVPNNPNNIKLHNNGNKHKSNIKPYPEIQTKAVHNVKSQILLKTTLAPGKRRLESQTQSKVAPNLLPETVNAKVHLQTKGVASSSTETLLTKRRRRRTKHTPTTTKDKRNTPEPAIRNYTDNGLCLVCNTNVPNNVFSIREHLKGTTHNKNVEIQKLKTTKNNQGHFLPVQNHKSNHQNQPGVAGTSQNNAGIQEAKAKVNSSHLSAAGASLNSHENYIDPFVVKGYCHLCKMNVPNNISNIKGHINGNTHKTKLSKSIANKRDKPSGNVSQNLTAAAGTSQSIAGIQKMNAKVNNPELHHARIDINLPENNINPYIKRGYCQLCKINVPNNDRNIKDHLNGKSHKKLQLLKSNTDDKQQNIPGASGINKVRDVYYECHICNVNVSNNTNCIKMHIEGASHKNNVEKLKPKQVSISGVAEDSSNNDNITNLEKNDFNTSSNSVENEVRKEITEVDIAANATISNSRLLSTEIVNERTDSTEIINDAKNVMEIDKKNNVDTIKDSANVTECDNSVTNEVDDINLDNTRTKSGSANVTEYADSVTYEVDDINLDNTRNKSGQVVKLGDNDTNECGDDNNNDKIATLAECNKILDVAGTTVNAETRNSNITNENNTDAANDIKNNMTIVTSPNNDEKMNITSTNQTDLTNTDTNTNDSNIKVVVTSPVDGKSKTDKSETKTDDSCEGIYICSVCNESMSDSATVIQNHLKSFHHGNRLKEKEGSLPNADAHFCDICKVEVPKNPISIKKHNDSEMHKNKFDVVVLDNQIKIRDDKVCFCEPCDVYFSKASVSSHINRAKHKVLISK